MTNWETELTAAGVKLGKSHIKQGIFQSIVTATVRHRYDPNHLSTTTVQQKYQFGEKGKKINHVLFMHDLKLYGKNDKELESLVHTV